MMTAFKKTALVATLAVAAVTLSGCVLEPAPYYGGAYYSAPPAIYVTPRPYYYGPGYWGGGHRWHGGHGGWH
jgi:hypothetical protein